MEIAHDHHRHGSYPGLEGAGGRGGDTEQLAFLQLRGYDRYQGYLTSPVLQNLCGVADPDGDRRGLMLLVDGITFMMMLADAP